MARKGHIALAIGGGALLASGVFRKKRKSTAVQASVAASRNQEFLDPPHIGMRVYGFTRDDFPLTGKESILHKHLGPGGRPSLGCLYQIQPGDDPFLICCEALYGCRSLDMTPAMVYAVRALMVRIDGAPWNQALYGFDLSFLRDLHARSIEMWTRKGVLYEKKYQDNKARISNSMAPSGAEGESFALIYIPDINPIVFDNEGLVTTEGMFHECEDGSRLSSVHPPQEILNLGFEDIRPENRVVGAEFPEGSFVEKVEGKS